MTVAGRGVSGATQLATQAVLARFLGPAGLGLWAIAWACVRFTGSVTAAGFSESVVRFGARGGIDGELQPTSAIRFSIIGALGLGCAIGLAVLLGSNWVATQVFKKPDLAALLRILAPGFLAIPVIEVASAGTRLNARMGYSVLGRDLMPALIHLLLVAGAVLAGLGILAVTGATSISFVLGALVSILLLSLRFLGWWHLRSKANQAVKMLRFAGSVMLIGLFSLAATRADLILVGFMLPASQAGLYNSAVRIAVAYLLILGGLNSVFGPVCVALLRNGEKERLERLFSVSTKWGLYASIPLALPVLLMPRETLSILFGSAFGSAWPALVLLISAQLINVGSGPVGLLLLMSGHESAWARISALAAAVGIGSGLLLIPQMGIAGAGLATLLSTTVLFGSGLFLVRSRLALWPYDFRYMKGFAAGILAAIAVLILRRFLDWDGATEWVLGICLSTAVFSLVLWRLGFDSEDQALFNWIIALLKGSESNTDIAIGS